MIWRGLGILGGTAALIVLGIVGLARLTIPDEPTFGEELEQAPTGEDGALDFVPTAMGGELQVTGAREGTITLESTADGPDFGLGNGEAKIFFEADPLSISQMSYDGLAFFPEPEECEFTQGEHNQDAGLAAVQVSCPELEDIRDNGTISLDGYLALPANLVVALDIPDTGGVVTVGDEQWEIVHPALIVGRSFGGGRPGLSLETEGPEDSLFASYDEEAGTLSLRAVTHDGELSDLPDGACTVTSEMLMVINPQAEIHEMTISCEPVDVPEMGSVPIEGTIVYQQLLPDDGH